MAEAAEFARSLSCPHANPHSGFIEFVVLEHARRSLETFIEAPGIRPILQNTGLDTLFGDWLKADDSYETVWNPAFGEIHAALLRRSPLGIERSAALVALRLHECRYKGSWRIAFPEPTGLRFDRWLLPSADAIELTAGIDALSIKTHHNCRSQTLEFRYRDDGWATEESPDLSLLERPGIRWKILTAAALAPESASLLRTEVFDFTADDMEAQQELLLQTSDRAMSRIHHSSMHYYSWVGRTLRELAPLRPRKGVFNSASLDSSPGVICVSNQPCSLELAEMLVHEGTHQYLYIAQRVGRLHDAMHTDLYYSPFRNEGRPIYNILLSYHAFANVLLFYREMLSGAKLNDGVAATFAQRRIDELEAQLKPLIATLQTSNGLTELGRALWEPLHEQVRAA